MDEPGGPPSRWQTPFFAIWTGQAVSLLGSRIIQFALVWWLTQQTGSATVLATASLVALVPELVLSPIAGAYVDRWNRRLVMIAADALVAAASLWLAITFWQGSVQVWHVYAVMVVRAIGGSCHMPAMQASTSLMVPERHLTRVAGINQTLGGTLNIVGPPLGALMMELLPLSNVMLLDVATALLAIVPLLFVAVPQPVRTDTIEGAQPSIWIDLRQGLQYLLDWRGMIYLFAGAMLLKIALTPAFILLPLLVSEHFGGGAPQLSLLEAVAGIGIVAGGLALSLWGGFERRVYTSLSAIVLLGVVLFGIGLTPSGLFTLALGLVFLAGFSIPLVDGPILAIFQATVDPEMQGRVFTLTGTLAWITSPIGLALAGPVSDWAGLQVWYLAAGLSCVAAGLVLLFVPAVVNLESGRAAPEVQPSQPRL